MHMGSTWAGGAGTGAPGNRLPCAPQFQRRTPGKLTSFIEWNYRKTVITGLQFTGVITGVITGGV